MFPVFPFCAWIHCSSRNLLREFKGWLCADGIIIDEGTLTSCDSPFKVFLFTALNAQHLTQEEVFTQICLLNHPLPAVPAVEWESSFGVWGYSPGRSFSSHCSFWIAVSSVVLLGVAQAVRRMSIVSHYCSVNFLTNIHLSTLRAHTRRREGRRGKE